MLVPNDEYGTTNGWSLGQGTQGGAAQKKGQLNAMKKKPADLGVQSGGGKKGQGRGRGKGKGMPSPP